MNIRSETKQLGHAMIHNVEENSKYYDKFHLHCKGSFMAQNSNLCTESDKVWANNSTCVTFGALPQHFRHFNYSDKILFYNAQLMYSKCRIVIWKHTKLFRNQQILLS